MPEQITVTGFVGTVPKHLVTPAGLEITSFRLGSTARRRNDKGEWEDGDTNWFTVNTYRRMAAHAALSIEVGQRVVVNGRLRVRSWEKDDKHGTNVEIQADALGHDLLFGTSRFTRDMSSASRADDAFAGLGGGEQDEPDPVAADPETGEISALDELAVPF